jgi:hypothetical protein
VIEEGPTPGGEHFVDGAGDRDAAAGNRFERFASTPFGNGAQIGIQ